MIPRYALLLCALLAIRSQAWVQPPVKQALDDTDDKAEPMIVLPDTRQADPRTDTLHVFDRVDVMPFGIEPLMKGCATVRSEGSGLEEACLTRTKVHVRFIVERDGRLTEPAVVKGACPTLDRMALECVRRSPRWSPGLLDGVPVRVRMVMPIQFEPRWST